MVFYAGVREGHCDGLKCGTCIRFLEIGNGKGKMQVDRLRF